MPYRARVLLKEEHGEGMHMRPSAQVGQSVRGLEASILLANEWGEYRINPAFAVIDLMSAYAQLQLVDGCSFTLTCEGEEAAAAFAALKEAFTTGYLQGTVFELLP